MDYGKNYWGLYRDCYRDPFPHSPTKNQAVVEACVAKGL